MANKCHILKAIFDKLSFKAHTIFCKNNYHPVPVSKHHGNNLKLTQLRHHNMNYKSEHLLEKGCWCGWTNDLDPPCT